MFSRLKSINKNQRGFTLIELMVSITITSLIIGAVVMSIFQVFNISARSDNHMLAVRQVQNVGYWINRDVEMAQRVIPDDGATGFPLDVTWKDWAATLHEVTYTLLPNGKLERSYSVDEGGTSEILVAQYINPDETRCVWDNDADKLVLTVTAAVSDWPKVESETRIYEMIPRPD